jgi:hypothetical protein
VKSPNNNGTDPSTFIQKQSVNLYLETHGLSRSSTALIISTYAMLIWSIATTAPCVRVTHDRLPIKLVMTSVRDCDPEEPFPCSVEIALPSYMALIGDDIRISLFIALTI